ncbi:FMN-dependent NADH-azoreductase [Thalassovita aquimarina]|uniref:FMN dependent NADH:quinone oxidoreductase n=1 Tax=Thalassovita aquimarina TaxID=2785917 RepID=A0ABS5HT18_9RHOB|nr:NAD(P)H-dependent oxidoreductase [Thalassovita aquimarina]MBR9652134.1 NAD(P)H-dependent oxidoreductase [Thalassovita aquimarina]
MTHSILHIDTSIKPEGSMSKSLTSDIVARLRAAHPESSVTYRDLAAHPLPETDAAWFAAISVPAEDRSPEQTDIAALSDRLIAEVRNADTIVIGLPVYNFNVPSQLKTWIDLLAQPGVTFRYTEDGPEGLIQGTRAIIAYASNGTRMGSEIDFASAYMRHILGFFGITDVQFVASDHFAIDAESSVKAANDGIAGLAA